MRNRTVRPWQFVLDPLHELLLLAEALWRDASFADGWNFGPQGALSVRAVTDRLVAAWQDGAAWREDTVGARPHEAMALQVDSSRAHALLKWTPRVSMEMAADWIVEFHKAWALAPSTAGALMDRQIERFETSHERSPGCTFCGRPLTREFVNPMSLANA